MSDSYLFHKRLYIGVICYFVLVAIFWWIVKDDWKITAIKTDSAVNSSAVVEIEPNDILQQVFTPQVDSLDQFSIIPMLQGTSGGSVTFCIIQNDIELWTRQWAMSDLSAGQENIIEAMPGISVTRGEPATLMITVEGGNLSFAYGNTRAAGRFEIATDRQECLFINGQPILGELVMRYGGVRYLNMMQYFWPSAVLLGLVGVGIAMYVHHCRIKGRWNVLILLSDTCRRYSYLLKQLVARDFKVKYKASLLGVLWSFLNPLLMTMVYYFVFSTIFKSNIDHFVIYLMSGIVMFNYFSESTNLGLNAIVGNAGLITKVYMPKYIYPLSKVISAAINLAISLIPLLLMMLVTGAPFSKSLLLLPLVALFMIVFCLGISLILSSMMVFFRDTQFLWSVLLTVWNFLTPIFYPESIIPAAYQTLYHLNPLYQIIYFMRTIVLGGISPTPVTYLYCMLASFGTLLVGVVIFRKTQDRFALYL